ncbi:hypothetical protein EON66_05080 [archaeon]|nr:MAG: hypothetical protein EON66_05080 [archaeon]
MLAAMNVCCRANQSAGAAGVEGDGAPPRTPAPPKLLSDVLHTITRDVVWLQTTLDSIIDWEASRAENCVAAQVRHARRRCTR